MPSDDSAKVAVTEYTDPVCSWAWGTEPKLRLLQWRHGHRLDWRVVMGGLVGDASQRRADWDPVRAAEPMSAYWRRTSGYTGQPYPMPMHRMARSTDPAGRAVKAALQQGPEIAARVLRRCRESTFVFGVTPETPEQFAAVAAGIPGLDVAGWLAAIADPSSGAAYLADWEETRRPNDHVRFLEGDQVGIGSLKHSDGHDRYAFPTLIMRGSGGEVTVPGWMPFDAYVAAVESACPGSTSDPRPDPTVAEAFARWGSLTDRELEVICGPDATARIPEGVVSHFWGAGLVHFTPAEAAARGLPSVSSADGRALADLAETLELAFGLVAKVDPAGWEGATPCAAWNVRALVDHMIGGLRLVIAGLQQRPIGTDASAGRRGTDPIASYRSAIDELLTLYRSDPSCLGRDVDMAWGVLTGADLAIMFAADHLVHAWDVARSIGQPVDPDPALVARIRLFGDGYVATHRGPEMFDDAVEAAVDAAPLDRLAAYVGRRV